MNQESVDQRDIGAWSRDWGLTMAVACCQTDWGGGK